MNISTLFLTCSFGVCCTQAWWHRGRPIRQESCSPPALGAGPYPAASLAQDKISIIYTDGDVWLCFWPLHCPTHSARQPQAVGPGGVLPPCTAACGAAGAVPIATGALGAAGRLWVGGGCWEEGPWISVSSSSTPWTSASSSSAGQQSLRDTQLGMEYSFIQKISSHGIKRQ